MDLLHLCKTNTYFRDICYDEVLWKNLVDENFTGHPQIGNSWFQTYMYYNRTVFSLVGITDGKLGINNIYDNIDIAKLDFTTYIMEAHGVMDADRYPDLQLTDDDMSIDQNMGAEQARYIKELVNHPEGPKDYMIKIWGNDAPNNYPEYFAMSDNDLRNVFISFLRKREQYLDLVFSELLINGNIELDGTTYYLRREIIQS